MNSKTLIGVVAVVVIVIAVAAVAVGMGGGDDENKGFVGVVYDGNDGVTYEGSPTFRLTSTSVSNNMFTNSGYAFVGWNTSADGSGTSYAPGSTISYPAHGYVTLYAQWAPAINLGMGQPAGISIYLVDSEASTTPLVAGGVALPEGGSAGLIAFGPEGTTWTQTGEFSFKGVHGNTTYTLTFSLEGVTNCSAELMAGTPGIIFNFDGPVTGDIYGSSGTSTVPN